MNIQVVRIALTEIKLSGNDSSVPAVSKLNSTVDSTRVRSANSFYHRESGAYRMNMQVVLKTKAPSMSCNLESKVVLGPDVMSRPANGFW